MKRILSVLIVAIISIFGLFQVPNVNAQAGAKFTVKLTKCVDGDTAYFTKVGKSRFLYVDTPESTNRIEPYGKEASAFTCKALKQAKTIQLQYDGPKKDKYGRTLVWVWVNGSLFQKTLINKGYVKQFYDYGTYSYESELRSLQAKAQKNKVGLWSRKSTTSTSSKKPVTTKTSTSSKTQVFANCTALRKAYPHGVPKGHPAYQAKMDRDHDNWACEK